MKRTAFDLFHPIVAFGYFAVMFACGWRLSDLRPGRGDD